MVRVLDDQECGRAARLLELSDGRDPDFGLPLCAEHMGRVEALLYAVGSHRNSVVVAVDGRHVERIVRDYVDRAVTALLASAPTGSPEDRGCRNEG